MQQQFGTLQVLRLATERENLSYVLSHAELTDEEQSNVQRRLAIVEDELLQDVVNDLPT